MNETPDKRIKPVNTVWPALHGPFNDRRKQNPIHSTTDLEKPIFTRIERRFSFFFLQMVNCKLVQIDFILYPSDIRNIKWIWLNFEVQITNYLSTDSEVHCQEVKEYSCFV